VLQDPRFEVVNDVKVGLVCFKLKGSNDLNRKLLDSINDSGRLHMVPTYMKGEYVIRMAVCAEKATEDDMEAAWQITKEFADALVLPSKSRSSYTIAIAQRKRNDCSFSL